MILIFFYFLDIDECANTTINVCQHLCVNSEGSFKCGCNQGFELSSDKSSCQGLYSCYNHAFEA